MKRRDFMKLSAATALSATVAAMAPSALAATELDQTNGDLHTTVDRKTAAMGLGDGKTFAYDPEKPYLNVNVGLFHNAQVMVDGQNVGTATYYLPDGMDPWAPAVIVLTPDNTTARAFSGSVTGRMWRTVACKNKIAVAFFGPENGGSWNLSLSSAGRDDAAALDALYQLMRKKGVKLSGAFSMDKSHTALVGYKEGGAAALLFGARWASDFSSICAVDAVEVPAASLEAVGGEYVLPFPGDSTRGVQEEALMREAMRRVARTGRPVVAHCEVEALLDKGYIHDGGYCRAHGHRGISSESEWRQVERDIRLAAETGCRYHVCHVSTKESVELVRRAKAAGLPVSCETAPHYLVLCDEDLREEGRFKMNPPLRSRADREALVAGLQDGTIEVIATDHAPHTAAEKARGLAGSAMGVVGLECAFAVLNTALVGRGIISFARLVEAMAVAPRRIFSLGGGTIAAGEPADLTAVDTERAGTVDPDRFLSMGRSTPFAGMAVRGEVMLTLVGGREAYRNGDLKR